MSGTPPRKPDPDEDRDYYRVLSDVMEDQKERESRRQSASAVQRANRSNSNTLATVAMVCGALSVYVWTNPPDLIQPRPFEEESVAVQDAGLKFAIQVGARAVENYREANGRLPDQLSELGVPSGIASSIEYRRVSATVYEIRSFDDGDTLSFRSDQGSLAGFVGNAGEVLLGTGGGE